jgi:hypothetical protein
MIGEIPYEILIYLYGIQRTVSPPRLYHLAEFHLSHPKSNDRVKWMPRCPLKGFTFSFVVSRILGDSGDPDATMA